MQSQFLAKKSVIFALTWPESPPPFSLRDRFVLKLRRCYLVLLTDQGCTCSPKTYIQLLETPWLWSLLLLRSCSNWTSPGRSMVGSPFRSVVRTLQRIERWAVTVAWTCWFSCRARSRATLRGTVIECVLLMIRMMIIISILVLARMDCCLSFCTCVGACFRPHVSSGGVGKRKSRSIRGLPVQEDAPFQFWEQDQRLLFGNLKSHAWRNSSTSQGHSVRFFR